VGGYREISVVDNDVWLSAYNFQIRVDAEYVRSLSTLSKVERNSQLLGQHLYLNVGATVSSKESGNFSKEDVITTFPIGNAKRFFDGNNVDGWEVAWGGLWLDYRRDEMSGPRTPEMFEAPKLLIRIRTAQNERLIGTLDDSGMYCDHTVIVCCSYDLLEGTRAKMDYEGIIRVDDPVRQTYLLAAINSSLLSWVFTRKFSTGALQGSYSDVWPQSVRQFPIRRIHFTTPAKERAGLVKRAVQRYEESLASGDAAPLLALVEELLPRDAEGKFLAFKPGATGAEEKSDVVHDLLAHLAEEMIRLNKEKRAEMKRWLGWLEMRVALPSPPTPLPKAGEGSRKEGAGIDSLTGKTTLQNYLGDYQKGEAEATFEEIWKVLLKNKGKLGVPLTQPGLEAELRREYRKSLALLLPIKRRLAFTDRLIDQIVYRLYGLNVEEVAIVEGRG
jgi:hypothetical protein